MMARPKKIQEITKESTVARDEVVDSSDISLTKTPLIIDLGGSLKVGDFLTEEQYNDLIAAGFTKERLFGE